MNFFSTNKTFNLVWLVALFAVPILLWCLPSDFFDEGIQTCPSMILFGLECLGCGITRAVQHAHHFEYADALYFNTLVVFVYPLLIILWIIFVINAAMVLGILKKTKDMQQM